MRTASIALLTMLVVGCESFRADEFEQAYVVESYQVADEPFAPVRLSRTVPIGESFNHGTQAVRGASVTVHQLGGDGRVERSFEFAEVRGGVYRTIAEDVVRPETTYRLEIVTVEGHEIRSETYVPATFELIEASARSLRYRGPEQLALRVSTSPYPGRQAVYILTNESLDPRPENLTPPYRSFYDDGTFTIDDIRVGASPLLNEGNYERDGSNVVIRLPWLAVPFFGPSVVTISVLDDNLFDFLRTQSVQQGGSTLPPGEIPNVIDHVQGGTGVFGSMARIKYQIEIER